VLSGARKHRQSVKANRGSGGVDEQSLEAFEAQLEQQLDRLQRELKRAERGYLLASAGATTRSRRGTNLASIECSAYPRFTIACVSKRYSIGWSLSSSRYSTMPASDIGEGDLARRRRSRLRREKISISERRLRLKVTMHRRIIVSIPATPLGEAIPSCAIALVAGTEKVSYRATSSNRVARFES